MKINSTPLTANPAGNPKISGPKGKEQTPYERFESLAKRLLHVSKDEAKDQDRRRSA